MKVYIVRLAQELRHATPVKYNELKRKFREWEADTLKGCGIRSRCLTNDEEDASIFHVKKARSRGLKSKINELKTTDTNRPLMQGRDINQNIIQHFESVFKAKHQPNVSFEKRFLDGVRNVYKRTDSVSNGTLTQLSNQSDQAAAENDPVSNSKMSSDPLLNEFDSEEIKAIFPKLKRNKAPGLDGIPYEFYIVFWPLLQEHFVAMMKYVLLNKSVLPSQGTAAIRLVPKKQNPEKITDYRPIALLNSDYKIIASVLASRLRKTLNNTIREHQKGGVPGRFIFYNLAVFRDVMEITSSRAKKTVKYWREHGAAILGFDFEKAYDLVNRDILWKIMETMGYPDKFISWLKAL